MTAARGGGYPSGLICFNWSVCGKFREAFHGLGGQVGNGITRARTFRSILLLYCAVHPGIKPLWPPQSRIGFEAVKFNRRTRNSGFREVLLRTRVP